MHSGSIKQIKQISREFWDGNKNHFLALRISRQSLPKRNICFQMNHLDFLSPSEWIAHKRDCKKETLSYLLLCLHYRNVRWEVLSVKLSENLNEDVTNIGKVQKYFCKFKHQLYKILLLAVDPESIPICQC